MPRTAAITVHVDPETKAALERLANDDGRTLSKYMERLILAHLASETSNIQSFEKCSHEFIEDPQQ